MYVKKYFLVLYVLKAVYTAEKNGPGPAKKVVRTQNFCKEILEFLQGHRRLSPLQKLQYFFTKNMGPYHFFDGSGPIFFCSVNAPLVRANSTLVILVLSNFSIITTVLHSCVLYL